MLGRTICYFVGRIVFPIPRIPPGSLPKHRQVLTRITRILDDIVAVRGRYEPGRHGARLGFALALSLLIHAFVLSLRFGFGGFGLPGVALPWAERRAFSSDLSVRLAEAPRARTAPATPGKPETMRRPSAVEPLVIRPPAVQPRTVLPPGVRLPAPRTLVARTPAKPKRTKRRSPHAKAPVVAHAAPAPVMPAAPAREPASEPARQPSAQPELIAQAEPQQETFSVPPPMPGVPEPAPAVVPRPPVEELPPPVTEPEPAAPAPEPASADEEAARGAREQEDTRLEQARLQEDARRQEEERAAREALELEARRQAEETARQQAAALAHQRALELEAKRQEEANAARLALELETLRQAEEAARQAAALARQRDEAALRQAEELAARERAAQELAERRRAEALAASQRQRDAERLAADNAAARAAPAGAEPGRSAAGTIGPRSLSGRDLAAKALEQLRAPGALRAEPPGPRPLSQLPLSPRSFAGAENPRPRQAPGGAERDIGLRMYVEGWRWKIERNGNLNYPSGARTRAAENPVVTVAIRRDGSVEQVLIHRSSGQRDLDEAVRRIVQLNAPYSAFPPDLARAYDVIEIRRVWVFADRLRILEDLN